MHPMNRRELVRVGGLAMGGLALPRLLKASPSDALHGPSFGKAKNVIFLYLNGGPPQHETFDPKPNAPVEIRGPLKPIQTTVPGMQFCELLPRTAALADKLAVIRSMATDDNIHSSSGHWVLTGYKYQGPNARTIQPSDWPFYGSQVKRYRPSEVMPGLSTVMIPDVIRLNASVTPAGQTGGLMGAQWNPERFVGDPSREDYRIEGLEPLGITTGRLQQRRRLQQKLEDRLREVDGAKGLDVFSTYQRQAFDLLTSGKARTAFSIDQEPAAVRDRYGRNRWGQCVLLARRLIESGVRLVHVNWPREPGDNASDNPLWDTHAQNHDRLEDVLCPIFDVGYSALITDLQERGLLDETLVVAIGEFGRTPKINAKGGRDHWGSVFCCTLAGAGIRGGQIYGSSDRDGAYPLTDRVEPGNLTSTIFHLLGLDHRGTFTDPVGRELSLSQKEPLFRLLGEQQDNLELVRSTGDVKRVPAFDETRIIGDTQFQIEDGIRPAQTPSRPKGWRQLVTPANTGVTISLAQPQEIQRLELLQHAQFSLGESTKQIAKTTSAILAQEVRSPFPGTYRIKVELLADGDAQSFTDLFDNQLTCHLVYFQFTKQDKQINGRKVMAEQQIKPTLVGGANRTLQAFEFTKQFVNPTPGSNFSFGLGLGVGLEIRNTSGRVLSVSKQVALRVTRYELEFLGKERNKDVTS